MGKGMVCFSEDYLKGFLQCYYDRAIDTGDIGDSILFVSLCQAISTFYCMSIVSVDLYDFSVELGMQLSNYRLQMAYDELEKLLREVKSNE